ncbi:MAG: tRNA (adenosine(37)-N6)-threonylcarbamoyltransferase complex dimerization subunit type 1 TsaB [Thermodesulfovibrionales bacterium]
MKILAIETSTMLGGVAIMDEAGLVVEIRLNVKSTHSERLMVGIDSALRLANLKLSEIDAYCLSIGPGSFTGLRIGLSTVKGFAFATGKPVVAVPTLDAFAWNFPFSRYPVCPMLDARKKEVYTGLYKWEGDRFEKVLSELSVRPEDILKDIKGPVLFAGEGARLYRETILAIKGRDAFFAPPHSDVPMASSIAILGLQKALNGEFSDPVTLTPFYIRKSEAEIKFGSL